MAVTFFRKTTYMAMAVMNAAAANADERENMVKKAVEKDLKYMRYILTESQYRKYLTLLNATFNNRGLGK